MYNQSLSTTTEICTVPDNGYCNTKVITTEITYQYFDLLYLILKFTIGFSIVFLFLRLAFRKRNRFR